MRHEKETRNFSLPYQRNCFIHFHPKINTSNGSDFSTVGTYDLLLRECGSPAWWWCYLRCSALADRWPLVPPPTPTTRCALIVSPCATTMNLEHAHLLFCAFHDSPPVERATALNFCYLLSHNLTNAISQSLPHAFKV